MNNINVFHSRTKGVMRIFIILIGLFWFGALMSRADTHYVSLDGANESPYTNGWASAASNIQWAVDQAGASDTVLVSNGTYNLTNQISITAASITVRSLYGTNSIINGNNYIGKPVTNRCVYMQKGVLDGFTISNGYVVGANNGGAGVYLEKITAVPAVYNNIICLNYSDTTIGGGGISIRDGGIVSNCTVISNTARENGGGICAQNGGSIFASHISGNKASWGGGIYATYGAIVSNCTVANNLATNVAGGIYAVGGGSGTSIVANCVISNNVSYGNGGGARLYERTAMMLNSVIVGNLASNAGGGVQQGRLYNCSIVGNKANGGGGGVHGDVSTLCNCIIYFNEGWGNYYDTYVFTNCCTTPAKAGWAVGNITNDPIFIDKGSGYGTNHVTGNYRLSRNSPCINTGTNQDWMTGAVDLDGRQRIRYGRVDMGAYETIYSGTIYGFR